MNKSSYNKREDLKLEFCGTDPYEIAGLVNARNISSSGDSFLKYESQMKYESSDD